MNKLNKQMPAIT